MLDVGAPGHLRPAAQPHPLGPHGLPHVHVGVAQDQDVVPAGQGAHPLGDPGLLGARHQVVHQDAGTPGGAGAEVGYDPLQVVHAVEHEDDHPLVAQVVAPDLLHELGVVPALDPDP